MSDDMRRPFLAPIEAGERVRVLFRDGAVVEDVLIENTRGDLCFGLGCSVIHVLDRDADGRLYRRSQVARIERLTPADRPAADTTGMWRDRNGDLWVADGRMARCARARGFWRTHTVAVPFDSIAHLGPFTPWAGAACSPTPNACTGHSTN